MTTDAFPRAVAALLADLEPKVKRQLILEDDKAKMRFQMERKMGADKAKEPMIDAWLSAAVADDFPLRQRAFLAWQTKAELGEVPSFTEFADEDDSKGKKPRVISAEAKTVTALKKSFKTWIEEAGNRNVEIYAWVGPFEFPEKVLATIPPAIVETPEAEAVTGGVDAKEVERLRAEHDKELGKVRGELDKVKKLLDQAKDKREADIARMEEQWRKERESLLGKVAELTHDQKRLKEEVSSRNQPLSQLKRDLEDALRQGERLAKDLTEAKASLDTALKTRDEAQKAKAELEARIEDMSSRLGDVQGQMASASKTAGEAQSELDFFRSAKTWMLVDPASLEELKETLEVELDIRTDFSKRFNVPRDSKAPFQQRIVDFQGVWSKLIDDERKAVDAFFAITLQETLKESKSLSEALERLSEIKDSLLAREMAAVALNHLCGRFLEKAKAPAGAKA
ncbi:MAG: hypothetical protein VKO21_04895 [Candidatus Sericytochromatia bacterium]|nr:hypothetical protein [Candidatus Sericytochromatia bacterium]